MEIHIKTIPHKEQRYETVGDWYFSKKSCLEIRVSEMGNWLVEMAVAVHELIEALLCIKDGISAEEVTEFDLEFARKPSLRDGNWTEPGDDPQAPYRDQHSIATGIERILIPLFNLNWVHYESMIEKADKYESKPKR